MSGTPHANFTAPQIVYSISIGSLVPRPAGGDELAGKVHSVFHHACNIEISGDRLVSLVGGSNGNAPGAIVCAGLNPRCLFPGQQVTITQYSLHVPGARLTVDLSRARPWTDTIESIPVDMALMGTQRTLDAIREMLIRRMPGDGFAPLMLRSGSPCGTLRQTVASRLTRSLPDLARAMRAYDAVAVARACAQLIGLGPGLTPSGDDFLVGWLAALQLRARDDSPLTMLRYTLPALLKSDLQRTHDLSRQFLLDALDGQFTELLLDVLEAIAGHPDLEPRVVAALSVGHSSGADTLCGLLFGLSPAFARDALCHLASRTPVASPRALLGPQKVAA